MIDYVFVGKKDKSLLIYFSLEYKNLSLSLLMMNYIGSKLKDT